MYLDPQGLHDEVHSNPIVSEKYLNLLSLVVVAIICQYQNKYLHDYVPQMCAQCLTSDQNTENLGYINM